MKLAVLLALCFAATDACAWGLQTHIALAQQAILPGLDASLVLAGACLPDLALAGRALGTPAFFRSHRWSTLRRITAAPRDESERALAYGYATHLLADVVAHNAFVPEHEARIARIPHLTHALAEWAMDEHVARFVPASPARLIRAHQGLLTGFVARRFGCGEPLAERATSWLASADHWLRRSRLPRLCLRLIGSRGFDAYIERAGRALDAMQAALHGRLVDWVDLDPEGRPSAAGADGEDVFVGRDRQGTRPSRSTSSR